jgi:hypothetical protein
MARSPDYPYKDRLDDIVGDLRRDHLQAETGWQKIGPSQDHEIDFENSWANAGVVSGVTNAPASWYLSEDGEVRLRGKIDGGAAGTVVFTLPEEVRPEFAETFICAVDGGGKANVTVHANGEVIVDSIGA